MAADILRSLETTIAGGAIQVVLPDSWKGKRRSPHTYAHGNLSKKIKQLFPGYALRTRLDGPDVLLMWLEKKV